MGAGRLAADPTTALEHMSSCVWARMAAPGEDAWDVGCRRARREAGGFSYRNAIVAEMEGQVAACMIGYPLPAEAESFAGFTHQLRQLLIDDGAGRSPFGATGDERHDRGFGIMFHRA